MVLSYSETTVTTDMSVLVDAAHQKKKHAVHSGFVRKPVRETVTVRMNVALSDIAVLKTFAMAGRLSVICAKKIKSARV